MEINNQNENSDDFNIKDNIYNFIYIQNNNENESSFKKYKPIKKYLISKKDFDKLNSAKDSKNRQNYDSDKITFYSKLRDLNNNSEKKIELSLVNTKFISSTSINKESYKNKCVYLYEINKKYYLFFQDNEILEMPKPTNNNILEQMVLLYANEKNFYKSLKSKIFDEYDTKEFYLINKSWIENYKKQTISNK